LQLSLARRLVRRPPALAAQRYLPASFMTIAERFLQFQFRTAFILVL
jgi:hypothetical protein